MTGAAYSADSLSRLARRAAAFSPVGSARAWAWLEARSSSLNARSRSACISPVSGSCGGSAGLSPIQLPSPLYGSGGWFGAARCAQSLFAIGALEASWRVGVSSGAALGPCFLGDFYRRWTRWAPLRAERAGLKSADRLKVFLLGRSLFLRCLVCLPWSASVRPLLVNGPSGGSGVPKDTS
jgi:hypothetical protein